MGFPARIQHLGCNFYIYVGTREPIVEYRDFDRLDIQLARAFFLKCIEKGVYFHTDFTVSAMHDAATLDSSTWQDHPFCPGGDDRIDKNRY